MPETPVEETTRDGDRLVQFDMRGRGRVDYAQQFDGPVKARFLFDDDGDGEFEQTVDRRSLDPRTTRNLILMLDGVPYKLIAEMWDEGHFRLFRRPGRFIAPLPALTDPCFSKLFHCGACPGYEACYFDRQANRETNGTDIYLKGLNEHWVEGVDYRLSFVEDAIMYLYPGYVFGRELANARQVLDRSAGRDVVLYILSTDAICHRSGYRRAKEYFARLDRWVERICYDHRGRIHVTMLGDHGNDFIPCRRAPLESVLESAGLRLSKSLRRDDDVVMPLFGLLNFARFHTRTTTTKLRVAEALRRHESVELVIYAKTTAGPVVVLRGAQEARIWRRRYPGHDAFCYEPVRGDPLELAAARSKLTAAGRLDADGFAADRDWLAATYDHVFPDPLHRAYDALFTATQNCADVVVSLADGWYVGDPTLDAFVEMKGSHGGMRDRSTVSFVMSTAFEAPAHVRPEDVLGLIDQHLVWTPHIRRVSTPAAGLLSSRGRFQ